MISLAVVSLTGPKLTQLNPGIKTTIRTKNMHGRLAIITLVGFVHISLRKNDQARTRAIPLECDLVSLEESLLRDWVS